ncbi:MAG: DNA mismatch repair protein MutS, partial [Flavobacteriaceae bacterium]
MQQKLWVSSVLRFAVFSTAIAGIYFFRSNAQLILATGILALLTFLLLLARHTNLQRQLAKWNKLRQINTDEIAILERKFGHRPEGNEYKDTKHFFSGDIDLFGPGSFYQYANRTALKDGQDIFVGMLLENGIQDILEKQASIRELSRMPEWRQNFSALAGLAKTEVGTETIGKWLRGYRPFVPGAIRYLPIGYSVASILCFALYFMDFVPESLLIFWLLLGLGLTSVFTRKIRKLTAVATQIQHTFEQYNQLLEMVEDADFKSVLLQNLHGQLVGEGKKTSSKMKVFSTLLNALDKNNNFLYLIFANGFFLRSLDHAREIENWIKTYGSSVEIWFKTIAYFDAYNALGNFAFNHPQYAFPELNGKKSVIMAKGSAHPLLDPEKRVRNDYKIDREQFFIITGANMAGKSTFLRTVSLHIVMANIGLPVCAESFEYAPIKLITSMRTADSLADAESYFFSELKRLKFIIDEIQKGPYFVVLDEILKGTNSTDKAKGSRKFLEKLIALKATGIIATHDLSLCAAADELPRIENHYFDAEIRDDELYFDYTIKKGVCHNMN